MKFQSFSYLRGLLRNKYFIRNLSVFLGAVILIFLIAALFFENNSKKILQEELLASNESQAEIISNSADTFMKDMRFIAATLDTDSYVNHFFSSPKPESTIDDIHKRLQEKLVGYVNSNTAIDSIYLYSERSNIIISQNGTSSVYNFSDTGWMDFLTEDIPSSYQFISRPHANNYPYYLTLLKQLSFNGLHAAVVINLNLDNLSLFEDMDTHHFNIYIVSDNEELIYRQNRQAYIETLDVVPELSKFHITAEPYSFINIDEENHTYAYTQVHSDKYNWSYVLISDLETYSSELSSRRAILVTILMAIFVVVIILVAIMTLRFYKPIQMLTQLLNESLPTLEDPRYPSKEISDLAEKIISYAQTNKQLSEELSASLNRLNKSEILALQAQINPHFLFNTLNVIHIEECKALGYEHPLPELTINLASIMRHAFDSTNLVSFEIEMQYTQKYINLMNARCKNRLQIHYMISEDTVKALVPKLFMQPIIENVFFHSFPDGITESCMLSISAQMVSNTHISISIADNGIGLSSEQYHKLMDYIHDPSLPEANIGVKNTINRMKLIYKEHFSIDIYTKEKEGTTFVFTFPISN